MKEWLYILRCPISHENLRLAEPSELQTFIDEFPELDGDGADKPEQALINDSARFIYPVIEGIPILLAEAAIDTKPGMPNAAGLSADKIKVRDFYDAHGWVSSSSGDYEDAIIYEDLRAVSSAYILKCHQRVSRHLPANGRFLLDAASGALQFDIYLSYSEHFDYRICVDFSLLALKEAKRKLGPKGIYILCDITNLPFKNGLIDAFVSLNTIYHIPANEQVKAIHELYRTLVVNGKGIVVYDWFKHSPWMNISLLPFRAFVYLKNKTVSGFKKISGAQHNGGRLYFYAHRLSYFRQHLPVFRLFVWRTVSVPFLKYFVHPGFFGKGFLAWLYRFEERHPEQCGKNGEYPMMIFEKKI